MSDNKHPNVDPAEISKFDGLASRWWDPEGEFRPLHAMNPVRLDWIRQRVGSLEGLRMLDVGCGGGILAESLAEAGAEVVAIDLAEAPLAVARLHQLESGVAVDYRHVAVETLAASEPGSFDVVTCLEMLEHVPDPASVVAACRTLLKADGHAFFSTINRNPKSFLMAIVGAEYVMRLLPRGTHEYARFIRPSELDSWLRSAGLDLADLTGMHYNPFTHAFRTGGNVDVNYIAHARPEGN
ncbi:MAG: bifunctional 2-polyprenyl-6-hydroxyphenol methylase/3-demethylubiquinol 3-O-methyltransferase UbiG [Gammaproteobacteria bacterium]|nr:bifunctional 2-polyprenyl-6-hydroxyphenol methylase/3-demethylubiquinol 3-O-methyltransferase UbiG [Gammaproteobacteria bacterium]